jgi:transcriptional regulator with XRE-family HTH domain
MRWHEFIGVLVQRAGGESAVVRDMGVAGRGFQGTLYKVAHGLVKSPSRATAEKIAKHFQIDVDALYSDAVARKEAARLGIAEGGDAAAPASGLPAAGVDRAQPLKRARVMTLQELAEQSTFERFVTLVASTDLPPHTLAGFDVRISTEAVEPADGALIVAKLAGGSCELGVCRMIVGGYELDIGRGVTLEQARHGLMVIGTAIETRRAFPLKRL